MTDFNRLVEWVVNGCATRDEIDTLYKRENIEAVFATLLAIKYEIEAGLAKKKAESVKRNNECYRQGPRGKRAWDDYKVKYEAWRADQIAYKNGIERLIVEFNGLRRTETEELRRLRQAIRLAYCECGDQLGEQWYIDNGQTICPACYAYRKGKAA